MKIVDIGVKVFTYKSKQVNDSEGHSHPGPEHDALQALITITADDGSSGYCFGPVGAARQAVLDQYVKPELIGRDPHDRELIWQGLYKRQRGSGDLLPDRLVAVVEMALWDLVGRKLDLPVWKLLGGYRDKVPAYGSTMCGDEMEGGLATPEDYGRFAEWMVNRGYQAIKLHTWMPPVSWAPDPKMDVKACAAVREAVGPDLPLMLDANHWYSREDALYIGRELEKLDYYWYEEPMDEHSTSSYVWLTKELDIPVLGPETAQGKFRTRAEWIVREASDITRTGVIDVGGIGPSMKVAHLAEAHGVTCEIHGGGPGNLAVLGAMFNGRWYERGLLHPFIDYDEVPGYLNSIIDPMDSDGLIPLPDAPGLGEDINFEYIDEHLVEPG